MNADDCFQFQVFYADFHNFSLSSSRFKEKRSTDNRLFHFEPCSLN
jgi:hypothetical protein